LEILLIFNLFTTNIEGKRNYFLPYRLNVGEMNLPALHERNPDIPMLVLHTLDKLNGSLMEQESTPPDR
jgi:DNA-binding NtrC family response regulator